jgi:hypothetical protein
MGRLGWKLVFAALLAPLFAAYGAWRLVVGLVRLVERVVWTVRLSRPTMPCPSCGFANALHGRWECGACSAVYHGFVASCHRCGAGASFFPCERCEVSIPLGPGR